MAAIEFSYPYRDYIARILPQWPELSWLYRFLSTRQPADSPDTEIFVLDVANNAMRSRKIEVDPAALSTELTSIQDDALCRLVFVNYSESWSIDRKKVDVIADLFTIDPRELSHHLDYATSKSEQNYPNDLRQMLRQIDIDGYANTFSWAMGGEVRSAYQDSLTSTVRCFTYEKSAIYLKSHETSRIPLVLVMVRDQNIVGYDDKDVNLSVFWYKNNLLSCQSASGSVLPTRSIVDYIMNGLKDLQVEALKSALLILDNVSCVCVEPLIGNAIGKFHRVISPAALEPYDIYRFDDDSIHMEIRNVRQLKRQVLPLSHSFAGSDVSAKALAALRVLESVDEDLRQIYMLITSKSQGNSSEDLGKLIEEQTKETKESLLTSQQLGRLSRMAYIFLPLQLTTSLLGMNLEVFGSGTLSIPIFAALLSLLCFVSFSPVMIPFLLPGEAFRRGMSARPYSLKVANLYIAFHLTHPKTMSDQLWHQCGIGADVGAFAGKNPRRTINGRGWMINRKSLHQQLQNLKLSFFRGYWRAKLDEIFDIIDRPQWDKDKLHVT